MAKVRVYELAKEFGVESKAVMAKLQEMGEFVRSASSTIEAPVVRRLKEAFAAQQPKQARASQVTDGRSVAAPAAPVVASADDGHGATNCRSPAAPVQIPINERSRQHRNQQKQRAALDPDDDGVILTYGHASWCPKRGRRLSPVCQIPGHWIAVKRRTALRPPTVRRLSAEVQPPEEVS